MLLAIFSSYGFSCDLTEEYEKARVEAYREAHEAYWSCEASVRSYFYYKTVAKCASEDRGKDVTGGCFHLAGYEQTSTEKDFQHCKVLKPATEQVVEYFEAIVREQNITRCSS